MSKTVEELSSIRTPGVESKEVVLRPKLTEAKWNAQAAHPKVQVLALRTAKTSRSDEIRGVLSTVEFDIGIDTYKWFYDPHFSGELWVGLAGGGQDLTSTTGTIVKQKLVVEENDTIFLTLELNKLFIFHENSRTNRQYMFNLGSFVGDVVYPWISSVPGYSMSVKIYTNISVSLTCNNNGELVIGGAVSAASGACWGEGMAVCQLITLDEDVLKGHMLIPSLTTTGRAVKSFNLRSDRVIGVAMEDGLAGQQIRMAIGGEFEVLAILTGYEQVPSPAPLAGAPPQGSILPVNRDFWFEQGNQYNHPGAGYEGVANIFYGGDIGNSPFAFPGTFAVVTSVTTMEFRTMAPWPTPVLVKGRFKKAESY